VTRGAAQGLLVRVTCKQLCMCVCVCRCVSVSSWRVPCLNMNGITGCVHSCPRSLTLSHALVLSHTFQPPDLCTASAVGSVCTHSCLQLRFWGKQQQQQEDVKYYVAIRYVSASGTPLPPTSLLTRPRLRRGKSMQLAPAAAGVPGS